MRWNDEEQLIRCFLPFPSRPCPTAHPRRFRPTFVVFLFLPLPPPRLIFGQAYLEVKSMLEDNLLRRFLQTDEFKTVRARRQHVTTMMVSPPQGHL